MPEITLKEVQELSTELKQQRLLAQEAYTLYKELDAGKHQLQNALIQGLREIGLTSIKDDDNSYSITTKKDIKIDNELDLISEFKDSRQHTQFITEKIDTISFKKFALNHYKETGELFPGTELTERESMSIRTNV